MRSGPTSSRPSTPLPAARSLSAISRNLRLVEGNNQLPALAVGDAVFIREAFELSLAFSTQSGLEGSRGVVEARVQDAGVVAGLVEAELGFLLNHHHTQGGL